MPVIGGILVATGGLCAFQVYWLMMWGIWGAPTSPTQPVAILGGFVQVVVGLVLLASWRPALWAALVGLAMSWCFYAPALVHTVAGLTLARLLLFPVFVPPALLAWSTYLVARALIAPWRSGVALAGSARLDLDQAR